MIERITVSLSWLAGLFVILMMAYILSDIVVASWSQMSLEFLTTSPRSAGRQGGIYPLIISTLLIVGVSLFVVLPVGLLAAIYLSKFNDCYSPYIGVVRKLIEVLAGVPSIVFGLFGNAVFSIYLGLGFSILSGGLTLACMALPLFVNSVEKGISSIPDRYYRLSKSLGVSQFTLYKNILFPLALPSILVGIVLSVGRSLAETAALIFTSGYVDRMPESLFDSGRSLSIHIYDLAMNVPGGDINAYKSSFVLIALIVLINLFFASLISAYQRRGFLL